MQSDLIREPTTVSKVPWNKGNMIGLQIPIEAGRVFRGEAGHRSDLMSATIPI